MPVRVLKAKQQSTDPIIQVAEKLEPRIKAAFLNAVSVVKSKVDLKKLTGAIESGDADEALAILAIDQNFVAALRGSGVEPTISSFTQAVHDTFTSGAQAALGSLPSRLGASVAFDLLNPRAVEYLQKYTFDLIQGISARSTEAIRAALVRAFEQGGSPATIAREIRSYIGLTPTMSQAVQNYRTALESGTSSGLRNALSRSLRDGRFDPTLTRALNQSSILSQDRIDQYVDRYADRYTNYRALNIARTESIRASSQGQHELWRQAQDQGYLPKSAKRVWISADDDRVCPECDALDGEEAGLDEEFAPGIYAPPDPHTDCRCAVAIGSIEKRDFIVVIKEFDPNQARDSHGRWTVTGSIEESKEGAERAFAHPNTDYNEERRIKDYFDSLLEKQLAHRRMNNEEEHAVEMYTGVAYQGINSFLRGQSSVFAEQREQQAKLIQSAIEKSSIPEHTVLFRGGYIPKTVAQSLKPGSVMIDKAFVSASTDVRAAGSFMRTHTDDAGKQNVLFRIDAPKGTKGFIVKSAENEVILQHGTHFKISAVHDVEASVLPSTAYKVPVRVVYLKAEKEHEPAF